MEQPKIVSTSKNYFIGERRRLYSDPCMAFWRELFQNSVDAGAKSINISVEDATGVGSFGRPASLENVVRVVFEDNGCGMSREVLDKVYFSPGESTKSGSSTATGGFGIARLMTCFSQVRYAIRTLDRVVEGDGPEYTNRSVEEEVDVLADMIERARAQGRAADARYLEGKRDELLGAPLVLKGCRLEVDMDPFEDKDYPWLNPTRSKMLEKLEEYLQQSQLPCKVFINGTEHKDKCRRGPVRRKLTVAMDPDKIPHSWRAPDSGVEVTFEEDGKAHVVFASIHLNASEKAPYAGHMIVRANGASMFTKYIGSGPQVICEITPAISRQVMTSNRDGIRDPYDRELQEYLHQLAMDTRKALEKDSDKKFFIVEGGKGFNMAQRAREEVDFTPASDAPDIEPLVPSSEPITYTSQENYRQEGFGGVPAEVMDQFLQRVREQGAAATFLRDFFDHIAVEQFENNVREREGAEALRYIGQSLASYLTASLSVRMARAQERREFEHEAMRYLNDIPVQIDGMEPDNPNLTPEERKKQRTTFSAIVRRTNPKNWDLKAGKGTQSLRLLTAWTTALEGGIEVLLDRFPQVPEFKWASGFYFGQPKWEYCNLSNSYQNIMTEAQHQKRGTEDDKAHLFLLNPINKEGNKLSYNLTRQADKDKLITVALHEISHVVSSRHNTDFANVLTVLASEFGIQKRRETQHAMDAAMKAVASAFGSGKTRVQSVSEEDENTSETRPSVRLSQHYEMAAATSEVDGTYVRENEEKPDLSLGAEATLARLERG